MADYEDLMRESKSSAERLRTFFRGQGVVVPWGANDLPAAVDWVQNEIQRLRFQHEEFVKGAEEVHAHNRELTQRLALAEQRRAEAEKSLVELAPARPETLDLPDLPDGFVRAAMAALEAFAEGYEEYGPGAADALGLAGQWGDLHRKVMKLKPVMWGGDGERLKRETPQEVLRDIIGHCLLALEMYERGLEAGRS